MNGVGHCLTLMPPPPVCGGRSSKDLTLHSGESRADSCRLKRSEPALSWDEPVWMRKGRAVHDRYALDENRRLQGERIIGGYTAASRLEDAEVEKHHVGNENGQPNVRGCQPLTREKGQPTISQTCQPNGRSGRLMMTQSGQLTPHGGQPSISATILLSVERAIRLKYTKCSH
jgi:hypothetical protein